MIYVFISQNIRLPSSTQFQIFKIKKHMKYTYSSKSFIHHQIFKSTGAIIVSGSIDDEKFKTKKL